MEAFQLAAQCAAQNHDLRFRLIEACKAANRVRFESASELEQLTGTFVSFGPLPSQAHMPCV